MFTFLAITAGFAVLFITTLAVVKVYLDRDIQDND